MDDMKKILVPVDLSHASTILLQYANTIAEKFGARLIFLFVVEDLYSYSGLPVEIRLDPFEEDYKSYSRRNMENFLEENRHYVTGEYESIVLSGHPAKEIIDYADSEDIDLIVIGTHGFSGLDRMIFGSVAEKVIKMAPCPIMVVNTFKEEE
ncbi:MAG: universal stress protein [Proteobacteria bacterium]|nr:universal stress protein [Pseudomonadota bacterium]MBU4298132.1 universal stress protein [Pseudomonadota bacterium]